MIWLLSLCELTTLLTESFQQSRNVYLSLSVVTASAKQINKWPRALSQRRQKGKLLIILQNRIHQRNANLNWLHRAIIEHVDLHACALLSLKL
ncbi:hypothetical protein D3C86_1907570 [compost metagenome]